MNVRAAEAPASTKTETPSDEIRAGLRESLPVLLGVIPFGLTCGVMGITVGLTPLETILMSMLVFAGAAQFVSMTMLGAGVTGWGILVLTTLWAGLAAGVTAFKTRNVLATMGFGMAVMFALRWSGLMG